MDLGGSYKFTGGLQKTNAEIGVHGDILEVYR